jgi:hypothetical protein
MHREAGQGSFAEALVTGGGNARLDRISGVLDWSRLEALLAGLYGSRTGRPSYPVVSRLVV